MRRLIFLLFSCSLFLLNFDFVFADIFGCIESVQNEMENCKQIVTSGENAEYPGGCDVGDYEGNLCACFGDKCTANFNLMGEIAKLYASASTQEERNTINAILSNISVQEQQLVSQPKEETAKKEDEPYYKKNPKVGDVVRFGTFEQDNRNNNGEEPVNWRVIALEDGNMLLLSESALTSGLSYANKISAVRNDWDNSPIRKYLNEEFFNSVFSDKEKDAVVLVEHFATGPKSEMPAGNTSNVDAYPDADKVFLLSYEETMKYLPNPEDRQIKPTSYAILKKVYTKDNGNVNWILRSNYIINESTGLSADKDHQSDRWKMYPDLRQYALDAVTGVQSNGDITSMKNTDTNDGIVPAAWIDYDKYNNLPEPKK